MLQAYSTAGVDPRTVAYIEAHGVAFEEVDIESRPDAAELVMAHNEGRRRVPTFDINGQFFGNPPITELKTALGLRA